VLATSQSIIRGLPLRGSGRVSIPSPSIWGPGAGKLDWRVPGLSVDSQSGLALPAPDTVELAALAIPGKAFCWARRMRRWAHRTAGCQRHLRQWRARVLIEPGLRATRCSATRSGSRVLRSRLYFRRAMARMACHRMSEVRTTLEHRLRVEQLIGGADSGPATSFRPIMATACTSSALAPPKTWSVNFIGAAPGAVSFRYGSPVTGRTAFGSTTRPTTKSAVRLRLRAT